MKLFQMNPLLSLPYCSGLMYLCKPFGGRGDRNGIGCVVGVLCLRLKEAKRSMPVVGTVDVVSTAVRTAGRFRP